MTRYFTEPLVVAFREELQKLSAVSPSLGAGATLGAIGALGGGYKKYHDARERGAGVGDAMSEGLGGALVGGAIGGTAGAGLGAISPGGIGGSVSRFGQRQLHSVTGWKPEGGLATIRGGAFDAKQRLEAASKATEAAQLAHRAAPSAETAAGLARAEKELQHAGEGHAAAHKVEEMGLTSLPGMVGSVKKHGLLPTMRAGFEGEMKGTSLRDKALMLGFPAYGLASAAMSQPGKDDEGLSKGQRVGKQVGELVGGTVGGAIPVVGQTIFQEGAGHVGKAVGGVIDRFRRAPATNPTDPLLSTGQTTPTEIVTSPSVSGAGGNQ